MVHDAIGLRWPSTSTRHCLQAPTGSSSGWSQNRGIWMPISSAARITNVPLGTDDLDVVDGQGHHLDRRWRRSGVCGQRHLAPHLLRGCAAPACRARRGSNGQPPARCASYSSRKHLMDDMIGLAAPSPNAQNDFPKMVSEMSSSLSIVLGCPAGLQALVDLGQPVGALAARRAFAARFVGVELRPAAHRPYHAGGLVEDLQRLGAQHRPDTGHALVIQWHVEVFVGQQRRRRAAGCPELQLVTGPDPAGVLEQFAQRDPQRRLVLARAW